MLRAFTDNCNRAVLLASMKRSFITSRYPSLSSISSGTCTILVLLTAGSNSFLLRSRALCSPWMVSKRPCLLLAACRPAPFCAVPQLGFVIALLVNATVQRLLSPEMPGELPYSAFAGLLKQCCIATQQQAAHSNKVVQMSRHCSCKIAHGTISPSQFWQQLASRVPTEHQVA